MYSDAWPRAVYDHIRIGYPIHHFRGREPRHNSIRPRRQPRKQQNPASQLTPAEKETASGTAESCVSIDTSRKGGSLGNSRTLRLN
jgi:hypothetical protein